MFGPHYVPLNLKWPAERILEIVHKIRADAIVVDAEAKGARACRELLSAGQERVVELRHLQGEWELEVLGQGAGAREGSLPGAGDQPLAYMMFTSGSTGTPKGVPITYANLSSYLEAIAPICPTGADDTVMQAVELTFDLSVHDMLTAWTGGARLFSVPEGAAQMTPRAVRQHGGTRWLSVPSAAAQAKALGLLAPGSMPGLKTLLFCGEALPRSLAETCALAAPDAEIINIYGPTEATIACAAYRWSSDREGPGVVPIGEPMGAQKMKLSPEGELMLGGPQLSPGYLEDPAKTAERFIEQEGQLWYLTGDLARRDEAHGFLFIGRIDSQIKLRGYRVELGEIETAMRKAAGTDLVAVVPLDEAAPGSFMRLVAFACGSPALGDEPALLARLAELLPKYMLPDHVLSIDAMPKNTNDKVDYLALRREAEARFSAARAEGV